MIHVARIPLEASWLSCFPCAERLSLAGATRDSYIPSTCKKDWDAEITAFLLLLFPFEASFLIL